VVQPVLIRPGGKKSIGFGGRAYLNSCLMTTLNQFLARMRQMNPQLKLFLAGIAFLSITGGTWRGA